MTFHSHRVGVRGNYLWTLPYSVNDSTPNMDNEHSISVSRHFQHKPISKMAPTSTEDDTKTSQDGMFQTDFIIRQQKHLCQETWFLKWSPFCSSDSQSTRRSKRSVKRNVGATSALDKIRFSMKFFLWWFVGLLFSPIPKRNNVLFFL